MEPQTVQQIGEFGLIRRIQEIVGPHSERVLVGLGDDTATVSPGDRPLIINTDTMIESVHFRLDWCGPADLAHKALASNLSDLACKCAEPLYYVVTLGLTPATEVAWVEALYRELVRLGGEWGIELIGGDTVRAPQMILSISAWGAQTTQEPILVRNAQVGDAILLTGTVGDSAAGLEILQREQNINESNEYLLKRFHRPSPRLKEALQISAITLPHAMTDISDGLARDLPKLCHAANVGASIDPHKLPCSGALLAYAAEKATLLAWQGGEDYELLLTLSQPEAERLLSQWNQDQCPLTLIGEITAPERGILVSGWKHEEIKGFDHFL